MTSTGIAGSHWACNLVEFLLLNIFHCDSLEVIHKVREIGGGERVPLKAYLLIWEEGEGIHKMSYSYS